MLRRYLAKGRLVAVALVALTACGRTSSLGDDDGGPPPDGPVVDHPGQEWHVWPDARPLDGPSDFFVWPDLYPHDGPSDHHVWPDSLPLDGPPDLFVWPDLPADASPDGPCTPGCADLCERVSHACNIMPFDACLLACPGWSAQRFQCVADIYCSPLGALQCGKVKQCLKPADEPDLTISSFVATVAGSHVSYAITACNVGATDVNAFYIDVYYDRQQAPGIQDFGDQFDQYSLAAGKCIKVVFTRENTPDGSYRSWAQVDADGLVAETNESNNVKGPLEVTVGGGPTGVDLTIPSMSAKVQPNGTVRYHVDVCNHGTAPSGPAELHLYYHRTAAPQQGQLGDKFTMIAPLDPGQCKTAQISRFGTPDGSYSSYAQVDPADQIAEVDEQNNVFGPVQVTVGATPDADLTIKDFTASLVGSTTVLYRLEVCNVGSGTSAATVVHVYYHRSTPPVVGQSGDKESAVASLAAGACTTRFITRLGTPPGSYTSWAQVDPQNQVSEADEQNNGAGPLQVDVGSSPQADLRVAQFNANVAGSTVHYSLLVCNGGQAAAAAAVVDLYWDSPLPPPVFVAGNQAKSLPPLSVGSCTSVDFTRSNTPQGDYSSWARVDRTDQVPESDEQNNVAGPRNVVVGSTFPSCIATCAFAISCGEFQPLQLPQCLSWCNGLESDERACVEQARAAQSCQQLAQCGTIPPPPPPPPPGFCDKLCDFLQDPCSMLPPGGAPLCLTACEALPPDRVQCAQTAMANKACLQTLLCLFQ